MAFNSFSFIALFLPIVVIVYFFIIQKRFSIASKWWLVACSLVFYGLGGVQYLPYLLLSIVFNYLLGRHLLHGTHHPSSRFKTILAGGIIANVSYLVFFKYAEFLIGNINSVISTGIKPFHYLLPLAISFFTFQQIMYLVDCYHKRITESSLLDYLLYVTFFPKLIAGPITHYNELIPQFHKPRNKILNYANLSAGLYLFVIGLFKKVIIADNLAGFVATGFANAEILPFVDAWATSLAFTFQLYFDFSGYVDMALGSAKMLNIELPVNFDSPYKATSIQDFWRRWHITLGRFLREYVYIQLGGNRKGALMTYINLMITFLVCGIWHGAGWTFIFWGILHGLAMVINRAWTKSGMKLNNFVAWFITFNFINASWVFFRASSWEKAIDVLRSMIGLNGFSFVPMLSNPIRIYQLFNIQTKGLWNELYLLLLILIGAETLMRNSNHMSSEFAPTRLNMLFIIFIGILCLINLDFVNKFIYQGF